MAIEKNFYDILGITPRATSKQIYTAIERMRQMDKDGTYSVTIANIETVLTNPVRRNEYDRANGISRDNYAPVTEAESAPVSFNDLFVDIDESLISHSNKHAPLRDVQAELIQHSAVSKEGELKIRGSFPIKGVLTILILAALSTLAYTFSQPLLDKLTGKKQVEAAMESLHKGQNDIKQYMLSHGIFPDPTDIQLQTTADTPYALTIDTNNSRIILTFNNNAISALRGHTLTNSFLTKENFTTWKCAPDIAFPKEYTPDTCF